MQGEIDRRPRTSHGPSGATGPRRRAPYAPRRSRRRRAGAAGADRCRPPAPRRRGARRRRARCRRSRASSAPLRIPPVLTDRADRDRDARGEGRRGRPGRKTKMWTYGGSFPGPTIRRPAGEPTEVTFVHELPAKAGELTVHLHGGHNRSSEDGQPGGLTGGQPRALYCDISRRLDPVRVGQRLADRPWRAAHLHLRPDRGRRPRARRLPVVPRPPPRAHGPQRVAGTRRDDDHRRRARREPRPAGRRARPAPDDRRPLARQAQPAHRPLRQRSSRSQRRDRRPPRARQRDPPPPPRGRRRPLPGADPQRGQLQPLQPRALQSAPRWRRSRPRAA